MGVTDGASLTALRGALGFLSRLPVGRDERAWNAFRDAPWTLPVAGYLLGGLLALPVGLALVAPVPAPTVTLLYLLALVLLTGITHADGVADLGDAAVVHGDAERRHEVMGDTVTGVGGTLALVVVVAGLALAALGFGSVPTVVAVGLVVASEVAAKLAMAALVALGEPAHEGFGAAVATDLAGSDLAFPLALALPAVVLPGVVAPAGLLAGATALAAGAATALALLRWARRRLAGVTGDVFGAANELARVAALHAGLLAWALADEVGAAPSAWPLEVVAWTPW